MKPLDIQKEVELTLTSLDRIRKASAPNGFAERLTRKMIFAEKCDNPEPHLSFSRRFLDLLPGIINKEQSKRIDKSQDSMNKELERLHLSKTKVSPDVRRCI